MSDLTAIDLFCGAGGISQGLHQAGYHVLAGNDFDDQAGVTYASTHPDTKFLPGPIENWAASDFLAGTGARAGEVDLLVGGVPCQSFSVYNHQRGLHDVRSTLYQEYLRIVDGVRPKWVVLENVTGMTSAGQGGVVDAILAGLAGLGYQVEARVLRAEDYGVPQERRRLVFMGNRLGQPIRWPEKTHGPDLLPFTTVRDAIGDLPELLNGEDRGILAYGGQAQGDYQELMRKGSKAVLNHAATRLRPINVARMAHIPPGGSWRDIPFDLLPDGMKRAKRSDHTKRYGRLTWNGLSSTILTKCDVHWGAYIHPIQDRGITVREAARFQSFPDRFEFKGSKTEQYVQVGNAVPPLLAQALGKTIRESLLSDSKQEAA